MKLRKIALALSSLALTAGSLAASADILFTNLGNNAPPATVGGHNVTPFGLAPQGAILDSCSVPVLTIPGGPGAPS